MTTKSRTRKAGPPEDWKETVDYWVEEKLASILGDPDEGLTLRKAVRDRLIKSRKARKNGATGISPEEFLKKHPE